MSITETSSSDTDTLSPPQLPKQWLYALRIGWAVIFCLITGIYIVGSPLRLEKFLSMIGNEPDFLSLSSIYFLVIEILIALIFNFFAVFIFWKKSDDWVVILISILLLSYTNTELPIVESVEKTSVLWYWLVNFVQSVGEILSLIVFFVFPNGRFVPRWTRQVSIIYTGLVLVWYFDKDLMFNVIHGETFDKTPIMSMFIAIAWHFTSVYSLISRYRNTTHRLIREQMKWVVVGLLIAYGASTVYYTLYAIGEEMNFNATLSWNSLRDLILRPLQLILLTSVPICLNIAIFRYRLWNINVIISTLVYSALTGIILIIYMLIVGVLSVLFQSHYNNIFISLVGTGLVAVLFQPLRERLQQQIDYLIYRDRHNPYKVLSQLSKNLGNTLEPQNVLIAIVETIANSLQLPYVAIALSKDNNHLLKNTTLAVPSFIVVAEYGISTDRVQSLSLQYQGSIVGELRVTTRTENESFLPDEWALLTDIARQAGVAVYNINLLEDLKQTHAQLIHARGEERKRIRNILHDELGPRLAAQKILFAALDKVFPQNSEDAKQLIREINKNSQNVIDGLRSVIYGLRPPALDELGLFGAIFEQIDGFRYSKINFTLESEGALPSLPAAIEEACYYIVKEAVTNVARHANASNCLIKFIIAEQLRLEIHDDGSGLSVDHRTGIGLSSMRMHAEDLRGSFELCSSTGNGTHIYVCLPLTLDLFLHSKQNK